MIPFGSVASANDGFDQVIGWDSKVDKTTHWLYVWTEGTGKTLTVTRGMRTPVPILVCGGGGGGSTASNGGGGGGGGVVAFTSAYNLWMFDTKETWSVDVGSGGATNSGGTKTRIQNGANTRFAQGMGGGTADGSRAGSSGVPSWQTVLNGTVYSSSSVANLGGTHQLYSYGGGGGNGGAGTNAVGGITNSGGWGGNGYTWQVSSGVYPWPFSFGAGGPGSGFDEGGQSLGSTGAVGSTSSSANVAPNGFAIGAGGSGGMYAGNSTQAIGRPGALMVWVPKVLA